MSQGRMVQLDTHGPNQHLASVGRVFSDSSDLERPVTGLEIRQATGTDFKVGLRPCTVDLGDGNYAKIPDTYAVVKKEADGSVVPFKGTVGKKYENYQNEEASEFCENLCGDSPLLFYGGGQLERGALVWYLAGLPEGVTIRETHQGLDQEQLYIWLCNSHVGLCSWVGQFTGHRPWCNNEVPALLAGARKIANRVSIRHTRNMRDRVEMAKQVLGQSIEFFDAHVHEMKELAAVPMTRNEMGEFSLALIGDPEDEVPEGERTITQRTGTFRQAQIDRLNWLFEHGQGNVGNSRYDAFQAAIEMVDHHQNRRSPEARFKTSLLGTGSGDTKNQALQLLAA